MDGWASCAYKVLIFILGQLGSVGENRIDNIQRPKFEFAPYIDVRYWTKNLPVTVRPAQEYGGGTIVPVATDGNGKEVEPRYFAHVKIKNNTKFRGKNSRAKNVFAKISFFDMRSDPLLLSEIMDGRWSKTQQPPQVTDINSLRFVDIGPGDTAELDLATKYYTGDDWYAMNTNSYLAEEFEFGPNRLKAKDFFIRVTVSGDNVPEVVKDFAIYSTVPQIVDVTQKK